MKILITTTSFQDTPGAHHELIASSGFEIDRQRGPLPEDKMIELVGDYDGIICGDDAFTRPVLEKCLPRLKVLSKYGIGLDMIDLEAATKLKIPVTFCPGVNHVTVAEHTFGLILSLVRNIPVENALVKQGQWKRITGREIAGKTLGILGLGRIGKEVAKRARAFEMEVVAFDLYWDEAFAKANAVTKATSAEAVLSVADIISLHMNLTDENREFINAARIQTMKKGAYVVNPSRGALVNQADLATALESGHIAGYGTDVLEPEPPTPDNPLLKCDNAVITPHIGSRTFESVQRQAIMAVENLLRVLSDEEPLAQAN